MVVVNFLVFVSEVVSIFFKILTWIIGGQKDTFALPTQLLRGACPGRSPKSTPMRLAAKLQTGVAPFGRATRGTDFSPRTTPPRTTPPRTTTPPDNSPR